MTAPTLEDRVVAFITERGGIVWSVELERKFPGEFMEQEDAMRITDYYNVMLCRPASPAMAAALGSACTSGRTAMRAVLQPVYYEDGVVPMVPIARRPRTDGAARWLPVTISLAGPGDRKDCGDLASRTTDGRRW